jgi:hypothetical protein
MFGVIVLVLAGLGYLLFGLYFCFAPDAALPMLGLPAQLPSAAIVELRTFYGGLELALGTLLLAAAGQKPYRNAGLWLAMVSFATLALCRLGLMWGAHVSSPALLASLGVELFLAVLAFIALVKSKACRPLAEQANRA